MIGELIAKLKKSGLLQELELSDEDIADSIWLALQMWDGELSTKPEAAEEPETPITVEEEISNPVNTTQPPSVEVYEAESRESITEGTAPEKGLPIQVKAAPSLLNTLPLGRALRPLMAKVPSPYKKVLNEEQTVKQIAEQDLWFPALKPEQERWLELDLVMEVSPSSFIWQKTVEELQQLLSFHGAFRSFRPWRLISTEDHQPKLVQKLTEKGQFHHYKKLIHPKGRGLIIVVSDCVSSLWQKGTIYPWLKEWSLKQPTAIMQLFPEKLWGSTELGRGRRVKVSASVAGIPSSQLTIEDLPVFVDIDWQQSLKLPIITPEEHSFKKWAKVVAGSSVANTPGVLWELDYQEEEENFDFEEEEIPEEEKAQFLVGSFLARASPMAKRLAGMMAAAPVSLQVVDLIRQTLLPKSNPVHVAEVYMGGLLQSVGEGKQVKKYDFMPGVRKFLNQAVPLDKTESVLDAVSREIAKEIGRDSIRSFRALLVQLSQEDEATKEKVLPFAEVTVDVLRNLGGGYAEFADRVAVDLVTVPVVDTDEESQPEPELQECEFPVAFLEVIETRTFSFNVATLQRRWGLLRFQGNEWIIKKQQKRGEAIIEALANGVELEMLEIPGGSFLMGSPREELEHRSSEEPQHEVNVEKFFLGRYPVTQSQWRIVAGWEQVETELKPNPSRFKGDERPVEGVSWYDAIEFCTRLSRRTGRKYRLPKEAEWEYACRAGTTTPFHFGEIITTDLANYDGNYVYGASLKGKYREETTSVGYFQVANEFGLYDMHGNVWEWCENDWHEDYKLVPDDSSPWLLKENTLKVLRGGSWNLDPRYCRSACRFSNYPAYRNLNLGFRLARSSPRNPL